MPIPTPTEILLIRHGETLWNLESRIQGHQNSPLTPLGIRQAHAVAERIARHKIDAIYTSDLRRASHTAEIIARRISMASQPNPRLRERNFGVLEGCPTSDIPEHFQEIQRARLADPFYVIPGGESLREFQNRAVDCVTQIAQGHCGQRSAIVTHGGVLDVLFRHIVGIDLTARRRFKLLNASLNLILYDGTDWAVATWGDIHHLESLAPRDDQ